MTTPITFASHAEYRSRLGDIDFWRPHLRRILEQHELGDSEVEPVAGHNGSNPTFVCGEVVVKLFGGTRMWSNSFTSERAAQRLLAENPEIAAPRLLGEGRVFDDPAASWPYLMTSRIDGEALWRAGLPFEDERAIAIELGRQVRRVHALRPSAEIDRPDWASLDVADAARQSSLPPHLVAQAERFMARLPEFDPVFVNSDLVANHLYVENGHLTGIIDWGDAIVADRHFELIQLYRDAFHCDIELFRVFLDAAEWPIDASFPIKAMGHALLRQAVGLIQHHTIDVFQPIAAAHPLAEIPTLEDLAATLFPV